MKPKYRIKRNKDNYQNPEGNYSQMHSPVESISNCMPENRESQDKRFKSQIIKPTYISSPVKKHKQQRNSSFQYRKTYSKINNRAGSPELRKQHITLSKSILQSQSLYPSIELNDPNSQKTNIKLEIEKFPNYVTRSYQMIQTKRKLLEAKHNITLGNACPILETIQNSVNEDKAAFSRKMKLELCKNGNYDLIGFLHKNNEDSLEKSPTSLSQSKQKGFQARNLPYLLSMQYRDPNLLEKQQMIQKMEERKRQLKIVRKTNLSRNVK